jgi:hypothetical protein
MTQALTRTLALALLVGVGALACGKYGPPVRPHPGAQRGAAATSATTADPGAESCEEDAEETAP